MIGDQLSQVATYIAGIEGYPALHQQSTEQRETTTDKFRDTSAKNSRNAFKESAIDEGISDSEDTTSIQLDNSTGRA